MRKNKSRIITAILFFSVSICLFISGRTVYAKEGDVSIDSVHFPDRQFRVYVSEQFDDNCDGVLNSAEIQKATSIDCGGCQIKSLQGIEYFTQLESLICDINILSELDVSNNKELTFLFCGANQLKTLNLENNTKLEELNCNENQLTELDLRKNTALTYVCCERNTINKLDVSKCIKLEDLECEDNSLTALNLSQNTSLKQLNCSNNQIKSLNLNNAPLLTWLVCSENQIKDLSIDNCRYLSYLGCYGNRLSALDIHNNANIFDLDCSSNTISELDIQCNEYLTELVRNTAKTEMDGYIQYRDTSNFHTLKLDSGVKLISEGEPPPPDMTVRRKGIYGQTEAREMLEMVNRFRTGNTWYWNEDNTTKTQVSGRSALQYDYELENVAMLRAFEISIRFSHTRPNDETVWTAYSELSYHYTSAGENIAYGQFSAEEVFEAWKEENKLYNGQGHRRNMLSPYVTRIGIAHVVINGTHYWVQEFASSSSPISYTSPNDSEAYCDVKLAPSSVESIVISTDSETMTVREGDKSTLPEVSVSIKTTWGEMFPYSGKVSWQVENPALASVGEKTVTGLKSGAGITELRISCLGQSKSISMIVNHGTDSFRREDYIAETCEESGSYTLIKTCSCCGQELGRENVIIKPLGHKWTQGEVIVHPTVSTAGEKTMICHHDNTHVKTISIEPIFDDIPQNTWYVNAVQYVYDNDIMTGKGERKFAPNANLHREEFTQMLYKNEGGPEVNISDNPFKDVKDAWYKSSVLWAKEQSIVSGKSADRFGIGNNITREELALMLYKYAQYKNLNVIDSGDLSGFIDADTVSSWAMDAVKWAVTYGIISGKGNVTEGFRIDPRKGATRAECAAMMKKFSETDFGPVQEVLENESEPIALPLEETEEDIPIPPDETEENIEDGDVESPDENEGEDINTSD